MEQNVEHITEKTEYADYLTEKYLPFRDQYLFYCYYPKLLRQFTKGSAIVDLGSGLGSFLRFCKKRKIEAKGYDTNAAMVAQCKRQNLNAEVASVLDFPDVTVTSCFCDNVLEHLTADEIHAFFVNLKQKMASGGRLVMLVPGKVGYKKDYTHKTFVEVPMIEQKCQDLGLALRKSFYLPFNCKWISNFLYLNMAVCVIDF